jgi:hypothetical protein
MTPSGIRNRIWARWQFVEISIIFLTEFLRICIMTDKPNFWDHTHPLSEAYDRLNKELIPASGNCDSLQGELLRAASHIGYDWYNNGWGCNNWSGAVIFLQRFFNVLPNQPSNDIEISRKLNISLSWVYDYSHGEPSPEMESKNGNLAEDHITIIVEIIVQSILDNPARIINTRDMFDFQEPDYDTPDSDWERDWQ